ERRCRLTQSYIGQAHVHQGMKLARNRRHSLEIRQRLLYRQVQHLADRFAAITDFERFAVVTLAVADVAGHVHIGQEMHFDLDDAVTLARFAASAFDIEREAPWIVTAGPSFRHAGEEFANGGEHAGVGGGIAPGRAADRALVHVDEIGSAAGRYDV